MLKNRRIAIIICVCVVVLATLFGVHKSLTGLARDIEDMFYEGVPIEHKKQPSVDDLLKNQAQYALDLLTVANTYDSLRTQADAVRQSRGRLLDAESISEKYAASKSLDASFGALYVAMEKLELTARDREALEKHSASYKGAQTVIGLCGYNDEAAGFRNGTSYSFIAGLLKPFAFVKDPEMFM